MKKGKAPSKRGKSKNGNKKHGRNKAWCETYARLGLHTKHKVARLMRHCESHIADTAAWVALATRDKRFALSERDKALPH